MNLSGHPWIINEMLPEQSSFTFQSLSQLQAPSMQTPWELQSSSIAQTYTRKIRRISLNVPINGNIHSNLNVIIVEYVF